MSCINDNGKGNMLLSYLFKSDDIITNINIEHKIEQELSILANKLKKEGLIERWIVAPDDVISKKYIETGESMLEDWIPIEENCELPSPHTPVLVSLIYSTEKESVEIDEINEIGEWKLYENLVKAWKYKPKVYRKD